MSQVSVLWCQVNCSVARQTSGGYEILIFIAGWVAEIISSLVMNVFVCSMISHSEVSNTDFPVISDKCICLQCDIKVKQVVLEISLEKLKKTETKRWTVKNNRNKAGMKKLYNTTVETAFYDHPLVQQKTVVKGRLSEKRGSLWHAHAVRVTKTI